VGASEDVPKGHPHGPPQKIDGPFSALSRSVFEESGHQEYQNAKNQGGFLKRRVLEVGAFGYLGEILQIEEINRQEDAKKEDLDAQDAEIVGAEGLPDGMGEMDADPPRDQEEEDENPRDFLKPDMEVPEERPDEVIREPLPLLRQENHGQEEDPPDP
jgi:hypothetical protein